MPTPIAPNFLMRPAHAQDEAFLYQLYASSREAELDMAGFPHEHRAAFCQMQFHARQTYYRQVYPHAQDRIIFLDEKPIGRELITRDPDAISLTDIALFPAYCNQGIGSVLLRALAEESDASGLPINLFVDQGSRAEQLYLRHGFVVMEVHTPNLYMRRTPSKR